MDYITYQILTNGVRMLILYFSYFITTVNNVKASWLQGFKKKLFIILLIQEAFTQTYIFFH